MNVEESGVAIMDPERERMQRRKPEEPEAGEAWETSGILRLRSNDL
jgi:hypothetical protein